MKAQKRRWGDRRDARRVRDLDPMHQFMPYVMPRRTECEVYINEKVDVTVALEYLKEVNKDNSGYRVTLFHVFLAAIAKTIVLRPYLNRFISGRRFYERDEVSLSFVVKKEFSDVGEESLLILRTNGDTVISDITRKVVDATKEVKSTGGNELDGILNILAKLPRPILRLFATILNILEYYNMMPAFFSEVDPYNTSVLVANLGSIKCNAPYHHLTNYGTNSVIVTIGEAHKEYVIDKDGNPTIRDVVDIGVTLDERIGDGFYFAKSVKLLKYLLSNPKLLERPFKEEVDYDA
ncbi:MAG: 2-oxo acid dehydrogenase subunit E2 [Clostridiales bacterium]|nr:2-oxo acid dehydrogenase subunit E2 [Clostridiales bacterium]